MKAPLDYYTPTIHSFQTNIILPLSACTRTLSLTILVSLCSLGVRLLFPCESLSGDVIVTLSEIGGRCERGGPGHATANARYNQGYHSPDIYANRKCLRRPFWARCKHLHVTRRLGHSACVHHFNYARNARIVKLLIYLLVLFFSILSFKWVAQTLLPYTDLYFHTLQYCIKLNPKYYRNESNVLSQEEVHFSKL